MKTYNASDNPNFPNTMGIYSIDFGGNKRYVGSAVSSLMKGRGGFKSRWAHHLSFLRNGKNHCKKLQKAYNKYGEDSMRFTVIEICDPTFILEREQYYINKFDSFKNGYNSRPLASNNLGFRHSEASKRKMSKVARKAILNKVPKVLDLYNEGNSIKKVAEIMDIGVSTVGKILKDFHDGDRKSMGKYIGKDVYQYSVEGVFIKRWNSLMECSKNLNIPESTIRNSIYGMHCKNPKFFFTHKLLEDGEREKISFQCRKYQIIQKNLDGSIVKIWTNKILIFKELNKRPNAIQKLNDNNPSTFYGGYIWSKLSTN